MNKPEIMINFRLPLAAVKDRHRDSYFGSLALDNNFGVCGRLGAGGLAKFGHDALVPGSELRYNLMNDCQRRAPYARNLNMTRKLEHYKNCG